MRLPVVSRSRHEEELAAAKAETGRQRERAVKAEEERDTELAARREITDLYCALSDEHDQTVRWNQSLCAQLAEWKDAAGIEAKARRQADRIARLCRAVTKARKEAAEDKRRADRLQRRLDEAVGLDATTIRSSAPWQPGYKPQPEKKVSTP